jgi:hypothetical protein
LREPSATDPTNLLTPMSSVAGDAFSSKRPSNGASSSDQEHPETNSTLRSIRDLTQQTIRTLAGQPSVPDPSQATVRSALDFMKQVQDQVR